MHLLIAILQNLHKKEENSTKGFDFKAVKRMEGGMKQERRDYREVNEELREGMQELQNDHSNAAIRKHMRQVNIEVKII